MAPRKKIALIGAGQIGGTLALLAGQKELGDVVLVDIMEGVAKGKALDLQETRGVTKFDVNVTGGGTTDYSIIKDADVCIVTAGVPRKPGMSREDLLKVNLEAITKVAEGIKHTRRTPSSSSITNPLDSMVYAMYKVTGFPKNRVVGMAGVLDTARFQYFVGEAAGVSPQDVCAMVLGGHGDDMVPVLRYSSVNGVPLTQAHRQGRSSTPSSSARARAAARSWRCSAPAPPSTRRPPRPSRWPRASCATRSASLPCSALLDGQYGVKGLFLGVPVVIGAGGVERVLEVDLNDEEKAMLAKSVESVRKSVAETKL